MVVVKHYLEVSQYTTRLANAGRVLDSQSSHKGFLHLELSARHPDQPNDILDRQAGNISDQRHYYVNSDSTF